MLGLGLGEVFLLGSSGFFWGFGLVCLWIGLNGLGDGVFS